MPDARIEIALEEGGLDAFVACPDGPGRWPAIILLSDRREAPAASHTEARRLAARGYHVLAPDWARSAADDRREDADAWFDHLADDRGVDDARVGLLGHGAGADLALRVAAWRAERVAAVAAFGGRGPSRPTELAQKLNAVVRLGYRAGRTPIRAAGLEAALCASGVDFDVEVYGGDPDWSSLLDLFGRTLSGPRLPEISPPSFNPGAHI